MTPLYSKETERRALEILKGIIGDDTFTPEPMKSEMKRLFSLIESGNALMQYLIMVDRTLCANGAYNASSVTRELIKKIKGEG